MSCLLCPETCRKLLLLLLLLLSLFVRRLDNYLFVVRQFFGSKTYLEGGVSSFLEGEATVFNVMFIYVQGGSIKKRFGRDGRAGGFQEVSQIV